MTEANTVSLVDLEKGDLRLADPDDDIRGLIVVDPYHHRVGEVDGLIVDRNQRRVRLLVVASGGVLGLDRTRRLVPVDAVTRVDDEVHIEASCDRVRGAKSDLDFDFDFAMEPAYDAVYKHFGYAPFWVGEGSTSYFLTRSGRRDSTS